MKFCMSAIEYLTALPNFIAFNGPCGSVCRLNVGSLIWSSLQACFVVINSGSLFPLAIVSCVIYSSLWLAPILLENGQPCDGPCHLVEACETLPIQISW